MNNKWATIETYNNPTYPYSVTVCPGIDDTGNENDYVVDDTCHETLEEALKEVISVFTDDYELTVKK